MTLNFESSRRTERWWRLLEGFECCWTSYLCLMNRAIKSLDDRYFNEDENCQGINHISFHRCRRYSPVGQCLYYVLLLSVYASAVDDYLHSWRRLSFQRAKDVGGTSKLTFEMRTTIYMSTLKFWVLKKEVHGKLYGGKIRVPRSHCWRYWTDAWLDLGSGIWDLGSGIWDLGSGIWDLESHDRIRDLGDGILFS